jgi:pentatricopeptide repeat protein
LNLKLLSHPGAATTPDEITYKIPTGTLTTPDEITYNMALSAGTKILGRGGCSLDDLSQLFNQMQESGIEATERAYTSLIIACVRSQNRVENQVQNGGKSSGQNSGQNDAEGFENQQYLSKAIQLFDEMKCKGLECNAITYNNLISVCGYKRSNFNSSAGGSVSESESRDVVDPWHQALSFFQAMLNDGVTPDIITYNSLLSVCAKKCDGGGGGETDSNHSVGETDGESEEVRDSEQKLNISVADNGSDVGSAKGENTERDSENSSISANNHTDSDNAKESPPDSENSSVTWEDALEIYQRLKLENVRPNVSTFNHLFQALKNGGAPIDIAVEVYEEMRGFSVRGNELTEERLRGLGVM